MELSRQAIVQTLLYSDLFSSPLTAEEIWCYLLSEKKVPTKDFTHILTHRDTAFGFHEGFYFLPGRQKLVEHRKNLARYAQQKMNTAKKIIRLLSFLPTVLFVGISGSVASGMAEENDDIDLFIITQKNSLWITRLLILSILQILGKRRKLTDRTAPDKICINMLIEEDSLVFPPERQEVYTAREIYQMEPLIDKNSTYTRFLEANLWTKKLMPNASGKTVITSTLGTVSHVLSLLLALFNQPGKVFQQWYISRHRTTETISSTFAAFHPIDHRIKTLTAFNARKHRLLY